MATNTPALLRLARAAIRLADQLDANSDDEAFLEADEELREAALGYRKILADHDVRRIGYGERTLAR